MRRYDKFRKSDKKVENGDGENEPNILDTAAEKKSATEVNAPA